MLPTQVINIIYCSTHFIFIYLWPLSFNTWSWHLLASGSISLAKLTQLMGITTHFWAQMAYVSYLVLRPHTEAPLWQKKKRMEAPQCRAPHWWEKVEIVMIVVVSSLPDGSKVWCLIFHMWLIILIQQVGVSPSQGNFSHDGLTEGKNQPAAQKRWVWIVVYYTECCYM